MAAIRLCLITDRRALGAGQAALDALVNLAGDASASGIDLIQIREKDLTARELLTLARRVRSATAGGAAILINDRFDVALASGAAGVHLTTKSLEPATIRAVIGSRLMIGVSTHSEAEVLAAERAGADYVVCGPVFATPSKAGLGDPLGPEEVGRIAGLATVPVLALGGIDGLPAAVVLREHVAGIAAIRIFQEAWLSGGLAGLERVVNQLRAENEAGFSAPMATGSDRDGS